jgi:hypothetical protein
MKRMKVKDMRAAIEKGDPLAVTVIRYRNDVSGRHGHAVSVKQERRVNSGERWDFRGHIVKDGIGVRFEGAPATEIVAPHLVMEPESVVAEAEQRTAERARRESQEQRYKAAAARLTESGIKAHVNYSRVSRGAPNGPGYGPPRPIGISISVEDAEHLVK